MSNSAVSANRLELLQIAEAVAREKLIDPDLVIEAMEDSLGKAARSRYGAELDIRANIDRKSGEMTMFRAREVVEEVENHFIEMSLEEARAVNPEAEVGSIITDPLPPMDFGRVAAQTAKQVIVQRVRDAERERTYEEFKDRVGEIINGVVRRVEYGNVIVDLGRGEGIIRRDQLINREPFRVGDRVRSFIREVKEEARGPQIFLSRTAPEFMAELFKMEVPEIYDGVIEIKAVARDPGSRAKIGVISFDNSIDPVGACVGMRGSRVQAVVSELNGEKIDIIPWTEDGATFLVNALQPAEVAKVVMDEDAGRVEVVVPDDQLSLAIGRRGQNVRLASQLTGWDIDIMTEAEESERRQAEFATRTQLFQDTMNVDEMVAQLLVSEGFTSLEEVAYVEIDELTVVDGFDTETAEELQARARESLEELNAKALEKARELGVQEDLIEFDGLSPQMILALAEDGILDLAEFATCADWELAGGYSVVDNKRVKDDGLLEKFDVGLEEAQYLVMTARVTLGIVDPSAIIVEELDEDGNPIPAEETAEGEVEAEGAAEEPARG
ncbi:MAG: transcription termination factor NusA [Paracoccaceae bacterium]|jgi:transcription termination/antitermination protein NusA|nr:transcription termination factor NusA [Paracoccaceae bacterium]MDG1972311.1 transcription termination factor NusA [Paracoccaceae bacterium]